MLIHRTHHPFQSSKLLALKFFILLFSSKCRERYLVSTTNLDNSNSVKIWAVKSGSMRWWIRFKDYSNLNLDSSDAQCMVSRGDGNFVDAVYISSHCTQPCPSSHFGTVTNELRWESLMTCNSIKEICTTYPPFSIRFWYRFLTLTNQGTLVAEWKQAYWLITLQHCGARFSAQVRQHRTNYRNLL